MLCFEADDSDDLLEGLAHLEVRVNAAEVVGVQLLQIQEVLDHEVQKPLTRSVDVQRIAKLLVYALQPFFEVSCLEVWLVDNLHQVSDLADLLVHDEILGVDGIEWVAGVMRGRCIDGRHQDFLFLLFAHVNCSCPVVDLQNNTLFVLAVNILVHDLNVFKVDAIRHVQIV